MTKTRNSENERHSTRICVVFIVRLQTNIRSKESKNLQNCSRFNSSLDFVCVTFSNGMKFFSAQNVSNINISYDCFSSYAFLRAPLALAVCLPGLINATFRTQWISNSIKHLPRPPSYFARKSNVLLFVYRVSVHWHINTHTHKHVSKCLGLLGITNATVSQFSMWMS